MKQKLLTLSLLCCSMFNSSAQQVFNVEVSDFQFSPLIFAVGVGDTVKWIWTSGTHTTTSTVLPPDAVAWDAPITATNTTYEYVPVKPGTYFYKSTPDAAHSMTGKFYVFPTSVPNTGTAAQLVVYPLPASDELYISNGKAYEHTVASMYDISGRQVLTAQFYNKEVYTLHVNGIPEGVYILILKQGDNEYRSKVTIAH